MFEPFFTTKPRWKGTGLGLDIAWRIVVGRHGGEIRVESAAGDTRFQVVLPCGNPSRRPAGSRVQEMTAESDAIRAGEGHER